MIGLTDVFRRDVDSQKRVGLLEHVDEVVYSEAVCYLKNDCVGIGKRRLVRRADYDAAFLEVYLVRFHKRQLRKFL